MQTTGQISTAPLPHHTTVGGLHISVSNDLTSCQGAWQTLENTGVATFYQTFAWCSAWNEVLAGSLRAEPLVLLAQDSNGQIVFILPLQQRNKKRFRLIEWMTAPHASYGFGLFQRDFMQNNATQWFTENFDGLAALLPPHDAVYLRDMPAEIQGLTNPLRHLFNLKAANQSHILKLQTDYDALLATKRSAETRRSMRKRDNKLAALGQLVFALPAEGAESHAALTDMFRDQESRLAESGVHGIFGELERKFVHTLMDKRQDDRAVLRPYRLSLDGKTLSVMLGGAYSGTYWALISSLAKGDIRKHSPGDHALRAMIEALCMDGVDYLDFSPGDSAYKLHWADNQVAMHHLIRGKNLKGMALAVGLLAKHVAKRSAKQNPLFRQVAFALRRWTSGKSE